MGLIVSVLLVCVGVYEFIQLCRGEGRKVDSKTKEIASVNNEPINTGATPKIKLCRDFLSHEDVEIECPTKVLRQTSKSPSPRRFLVTEKDDDRSRSSSPRKFVVSAESEDKSDLREFFITKGIPKDDPGTRRYVLIDTKKDFREVSPLPLPKQFVITQNGTTFSQDKLGSIKQGIGVSFNSLSLDGKEVRNYQETATNVIQEKASSNITSTENLADSKETSLKLENGTHKREISSSLHELYSQEPTEFHRDASPYPGLDIFARRGSITSELFENPKLGISEIDEDAYNTTMKVDVILNPRNCNTTEYRSNKIVVEPPERYKSVSPSVKTDDSFNMIDQNQYKIDNEKPRSKSATRNENSSSVSHMRKVSSSSRMFDEDFQESSGLLKDVLERGGDESFRNSLDGVKKGQDARRSFKKKKNKSQNSLENTHEHCEEKNNTIQGQSDDPENTRLIFSGEYTKAMNKDWHGQHFCCWQCDESLTGQRYVLRDDHPYCVSCYESVFANACEKCSRTIGIDSKDLSYKDKHWHEACFLCTTCGESLVDKQFGSKGERIYCGRCYDNQFASRCDGCNEIFRAGK